MTEPTRTAVAVATPVWKNAMDLELEALRKTHTWDLVPYSPDYNVVGCKWVFRIKRNSDGTIQRHKARLVAKGFHQSPGIDFFETFSPVVKDSTIRVVLSIAVSHSWILRQLDFNNAFLNGTLTKEIFMARPPGFTDQTCPNHVCRLNKDIYGLKQAPRAWNNALKQALLTGGFIHSQADSSLFILRRGTSIVLLLVYVDDVIVTGNDPSLITHLIADLDTQFALKDLGNLSYFLGIQVFQLESRLLLNQSKYVELNMSHLKPAPSPTVLGKHMSLTEGTPLLDHFLYRSTIGALQYLTTP